MGPSVSAILAWSQIRLPLEGSGGLETRWYSNRLGTLKRKPEPGDGGSPRSGARSKQNECESLPETARLEAPEPREEQQARGKSTGTNSIQASGSNGKRQA